MIKIWAHRGLSQNYPENTLLSFGKANELKQIEGIELDIQLTKDNEIVVIHDERVDRTTDAIGFVRDFTYEQLRRLSIDCNQKIPNITEVLDIFEPRMKEGTLRLNIELKNNVYNYSGMEEKIVKLIEDRKLANSVVYSSFYAKSIEQLKDMGVRSELGILDNKVSDCLYKIKGGCGATALHPYVGSIDLPAACLEDYPVRAYFAGHLYPEKSTGARLDFDKLISQGITDIFINEPEVYVD